MPVIELEIDLESEATLRGLRLLDGGAEDRLPQEVVQRQLRRMAVDAEQRLDDDARWHGYAETGEAYSHAKVDGWLEQVEQGSAGGWPIGG